MMKHSKISITPRDILSLVQALYARHQAGLPQLKNKIFVVDFPPLPKDEKREHEINRLRDSCNQYLTDEDLGLLLAIEEFSG
ncbi:MAG: hypothetical protein KH111_13920 [Bacteroidales bacterium]|nr:hypothetical protein [Bacteroidales bacterium]